MISGTKVQFDATEDRGDLASFEGLTPGLAPAPAEHGGDFHIGGSISGQHHGAPSPFQRLHHEEHTQAHENEGPKRISDPIGTEVGHQQVSAHKNQDETAP